jgi:hypothetical protein
MSIRTPIVTPLSDATRAAAASPHVGTRVDATRFISLHVHAIRTGAAPTTLGIHVDASSRPDPDLSDDTHWIEDYVAAGDLVAASETSQQVVASGAIPPFFRIRVTHTGADAQFAVYVSGKEGTAT